MAYEFCCEKFELLFLYNKAEYISVDSQFWAIVWNRELDATTGMASGFVAQIKFCPFCGQVLQSPDFSAVSFRAKIPILPYWHPRLPSKEERTLLFEYLLKLKYGTLEGLTEEERLPVRVSVDHDRLAVYDYVKSLVAWNEESKEREYSQIVFARWSSFYDPGEPFYFDVFAFWKNGEEIHQLTPESGFLARDRMLATIPTRKYTTEEGYTVWEIGGKWGDGTE